MSTISKVKSEETKITSLGNQTTMPYKKLVIKDIIPDIKISVTNDPIEPKRISKEFKNRLTMSSAVKAGIVFLTTLGAYYLARTTGIFSYFGLGAKNSNLKDVDSNEVMEVKSRENALSARRNLETAGQVNSQSVNPITQAYKSEDNVVKFKETEVEEFKDLYKVF